MQPCLEGVLRRRFQVSHAMPKSYLIPDSLVYGKTLVGELADER